MAEVGNNYDQQIRKFSWWKTAGVPLRTFVIAELWYNFDEQGKAVVVRVGLLELGFDYPDDIDYEYFKVLYDEKKLIPMNLTPVYKHE